MNSGPLPNGVLALLHDEIESFEQIEVLLLLHQQRAKVWTVASVCSDLGIESSLAVEALEHLCSVRLLEVVPGAEIRRFRYAPGAPELAQAVTELADAYRDRRIEVMRLLGANAVDRVRTKAIRLFADAFLIGGKKKDG
jgi:hypothetical protein